MEPYAVHTFRGSDKAMQTANTIRIKKIKEHHQRALDFKL